MQSYQADSAALPDRTGYQSTGYHLALAAFADDVVGTLARLFAYVGTLALLAILGLAGLEQLPHLGGDEPALWSGLTAKDGCEPVFTANRANSFSKSKNYADSRHLAGDSGAIAEPKRRACDPAASPDWLAGDEKLRLRGSL